MKIRNVLVLAFVALSVVACSKTNDPLSADPHAAFAQAVREAEIANAPPVSSDPFTPPFVNVDLEQYLVGVSTVLPPDGVEYQRSYNDYLKLEAMGQAETSGLSESTGYPLYRATCEFDGGDRSTCKEDSGDVVDEAYLAAHTIIIKNRDAIANPNLQCGEVCVEVKTHRVVGHVSPELATWRDLHCQWDPYGTIKCQEIKPYGKELHGG